MRVLVSGSRDFDDMYAARLVAGMLLQINQQRRSSGKSVVVVVHGDARGADRVVAGECERLGLTVEPHPADWSAHDRDASATIRCRCADDAATCRAAGVRRNQRMLDTGIDLVIGLPSGPALSRGVADMLGRAAKAGVRTYRFGLPPLS